MIPNIANLKQNLKLQLFMGFAIILFLYKVFIASSDSIPLLFFNDLLVILTLTSLVLYVMDFVHVRNINPLSLVMNIGILNACLFFLITLSGSFFGWLFGIDVEGKQTGVMYWIISFFYVAFILVSVSYIFLAFKELYFLKQKKNVTKYFNTMVVFFLLTAISAHFKQNKQLDFIRDTFLIISILLIVFNSIKISWIAFIKKKEKISLLVFSVVISLLFVVNLVGSSQGLHHTILSAFSPALYQLLNIIMIYGAIYFSILFFTTLFHIPTAEAFDRKAQEVSSLQFFSKLITEVLDFNDLVDTVTEIAIKVCNADAAWIIWNEKNEEYRQLAFKQIGILDAELITNYLFSKNITDINSTVTFNFEKFGKKKEFNENYTSVAAAPLRTHNQIKGFLVTVKKDDFIFDDEDKNAIDTFSDYASVAIENSRLLEESIERERLARELDVAREVQRKILPAKNPEYTQLDISSVFIPAFEVGGDYYDFFEIKDDKFGFVIADVSGKGISAAFIMAEIKGIFQTLSLNGRKS